MVVGTAGISGGWRRGCGRGNLLVKWQRLRSIQFSETGNRGVEDIIRIEDEYGYRVYMYVEKIKLKE